MLVQSDIKSEYDVFEDIQANNRNNEPPAIGDGELYAHALGYTLKNNEISISQLKKMFKIGHQRAKKVIDQLEKNNIIESYAGGRKSRKIKLTKHKWDKLKKKSEIEKDKPCFQYVHHILKIPKDIPVEEDNL